jgi:hypothetical protein
MNHSIRIVAALPVAPRAWDQGDARESKRDSSTATAMTGDTEVEDGKGKAVAVEVRPDGVEVLGR